MSVLKCNVYIEVNVMEKEKRLLYFFFSMISGKEINRSELIKRSDVTTRTLRRDVDVINQFFKDPESPWRNSSTKIQLVGKNDNATYKLINSSFSKDSYAILGLLISIKSLTPKLHQNVHALFKALIDDSKPEDKNTLNSVLNHFSVRKNPNDCNFPGHELMTLQTALAKGVMVGFKHKRTGKYVFATPHSLMYMNYDYWLTYETGDKFFDVKVRDIIDVEMNENFSKTKSEANEIVTVRVHKDIANELKQLYAVLDDRQLNDDEAKYVDNKDDWLIFYIACTKLDAYYIAYQKAPRAQILAPQTYVDSFLERMLEIFNQYNLPPEKLSKGE